MVNNRQVGGSGVNGERCEREQWQWQCESGRIGDELGGQRAEDQFDPKLRQLVRPVSRRDPRVARQFGAIARRRRIEIQTALLRHRGEQFLSFL